MLPTTATPPALGAPAVPGMPPGAQRLSRTYYDAANQMRTSAVAVPVDQFGALVGQQFRCRQHGVAAGWFALNVKAAPTCDPCGKRMVAVEIKRPPLLPWRAIWGVVETPLRPVWFLAGAAGAGVVVEAAAVPALVLAGVAPLAGEVARRGIRMAWTAKAVRAGRLERDDPDGDRKVRDAIDRQARMVGYTAAGATAWLALAAALGVDPATAGGCVSYAALLAAWAAPALSWWKRRRDERNRPAPFGQIEVQEVPVELTDVLELEVRRIWSTVIAARAGQVVDHRPDGSPVKADESGKLPGTALEDWHRLPGGWGATIVGPPGKYESEVFVKAAGKVASAYSMKRSMVTVMADSEDENRAMLVAQRTSPITDVVRWTKPESINIETGQAPWCMYTDGSLAMYELWRAGWGTPHDFLCGTTGAGKSEALSTLLLIDRWAHHVDADGVAHGLVADLLIDPQQGQSYGPFLDDLSAPVATSLDEAKLLISAVREEMFRRNRYLAQVVWTDAKSRKRKGRKWWNPIIDGPILTVNLDEAHEYLADKEFTALVTAGARMYRKTGIRIRVATHTPLLADLGGSMALRDMLTGGNVWVGRTANSLSGPTAFNGRMPVDPRTIPEIAGMCFPRSSVSNKPMLARAMWEPDYYDWIRDDEDRPIGFPAALPQVTLDTFGAEFGAWLQAMQSGGEWTPQPKVVQPTHPVVNAKSVDAVLSVLEGAPRALDMDGIDAALKRAGTPFATRTIRDAIKVLRDERGLVETVGKCHALTAQARVDAADELAVAVEQATLMAAEQAE